MSLNKNSKRHEVDHALRAELEFKAVARRNKRLGLWLADAMGLGGDDATAYARAVVHADLEKPGEEDVVEKVMADIREKNLGIDEKAVRAKMAELLLSARAEVSDEAAR